MSASSQAHRLPTRVSARTLALACAALFAAVACQQVRLSQVLPPGARVDVFPQVARAQLDALFVIDNSSYMAVHQRRVSEQMGRFLGWLSRAQIDWHIGLVTTDVKNSPGVYQGSSGKLYFATGDEAGLPGAILALGVGGAAISAAKQQADLALKGPPEGFLRAGADLFLVVVTDNDDPWSPGSDDYYYRVLKGAKGKGNDGIVSLSVLAGDPPPTDPPGCKIPDPNNPTLTFSADPAPRLQALAVRLGGKFHSICDPAFDQVFDELGAQAAGLKRSFRLAKEPDPATVVVRVRARCDTLRENLSFCADVADGCGDANPALVCTPRPAAAGVDGVLYDPGTSSVLFTGSALPPRGSVVEVQYQEKAQ
jgi:hypothetical protein